VLCIQTVWHFNTDIYYSLPSVNSLGRKILQVPLVQNGTGKNYGILWIAQWIYVSNLKLTPFIWGLQLYGMSYSWFKFL